MIIHLNNEHISTDIDTVGCTFLNLKVKQKSLGWVNTILSLGYDEYPKQDWFCGAIIGRYANRIKNGRFTIADQHYQIPTCNEGNALHGNHGLDRVDWNYDKLRSSKTIACFQYKSPDGDQGFPGDVEFEVSIQLEDTSVKIDYYATSDQATPLSLTHHPYFNLNTKHSDLITNHSFKFESKELLVLENMVPNGKSKVDEHFLINSKLDGKDYDDCFIMNESDSKQLRKHAQIQNLGSRIQLNVLSTLPSFQFYTGKWIPDIQDINTNKLGPNAGFCIEPQYYPDGPNHEHFPNCIFGPHRDYQHSIIYQFSNI